MASACGCSDTFSFRLALGATLCLKRAYRLKEATPNQKGFWGQHCHFMLQAVAVLCFKSQRGNPPQAARGSTSDLDWMRHLRCRGALKCRARLMCRRFSHAPRVAENDLNLSLHPLRLHCDYLAWRSAHSLRVNQRGRINSSVAKTLSHFVAGTAGSALSSAVVGADVGQRGECSCVLPPAWQASLHDEHGGAQSNRQPHTTVSCPR